ncbi:MAG: hypothetical protein WA705_31380, partial [Candidatus Ozemobacteraceae bacterium]
PARPADFSELVRREAERQCIVRRNADEWKKSMAAIRDVMQSAKKKSTVVAEIAATSDRNMVLDKLHYFVEAAGFAPLESTWQLIDDKGMDLEQMKALCILSMFKWNL